jgi:hypothetical protein
MTNPLEPPPVDRAAAARAVKGPAIGLIVVGALGALASVFSMVQGPEAQRPIYEAFKLPKEQIDTMMAQAGAMGIVVGIAFLALNAVLIVGGLKLMKLQSRGLAMTACILAMVNCGTCCCVLGTPIAIWGLIVLNKPEVKAAMEQRA